MKPTIAVIGAGASGLAAAIAAAKNGAKVILIEKNRAVGKKILASGGGKCNLSNSRISSDHYHGDPVFIKKALSACPAQDVNSFFWDLGLLTSKDQDGRIFPRSAKSQTVVDVLLGGLAKTSARLLLSAQAASARLENNQFLIKIMKSPDAWNKGSAGTEETLTADRMILASGGMSYPQLGAGEHAYDIAKSFGHHVSEITPALVPLNIRESSVKRLHGLRSQASVKVLGQDKIIGKTQGEVLFTDYGLSGPAVLDLSREAVRNLKNGKVFICLNLFPDYSPHELKQFLSQRLEHMQDVPCPDFFTGLFPSQQSAMLMDELRVKLPRPASVLKTLLPQLCDLLGNWKLEVSGPRPWSEAMLSAGGIFTSEIDPGTFRSKKVPNLHITGEMLDVDGQSGGYNLHWGWASGLLAGRHASV